MKKEYSKLLLIQESVLIWIVTIGMMGIALLCIIKGFTGSLPWLATMVAFPWTAYGISQAFYYKKSEKENTKDGIKFESVMAEINAMYSNIGISDSTIMPTDNTNISSQEIDLNYGI